jgi:hypothetical protein
MCETSEPVRDEVVSNGRGTVPTCLCLRHRQPESVVVDVPEVEAGLELDRHRQVGLYFVGGADVDKLAYQRPDRKHEADSLPD